MTPVELARTLTEAVRGAVDGGELRVAVPERIVVERTRPGGTGDYASNVALRLARSAGQPPQAVAHVLRSRLLGLAAPGIAAVDITGPGFLNFTLDGGGQAALVREILRRGPAYGHAPAPTKPTHPTHGHTPAGRTPVGPAPGFSLRFPCEVRAAVQADAVRRILLSQGIAVRALCAAEPDPAWVEVLGVHVDEHPPLPVDVHSLIPDSGWHPVVLPVPVPVRDGDGAVLLSLGRDAARWALLHAPAHDRVPLRPETLLARRDANPLFRVQYAHSRACALVRNAHDLGFAAEPGDLYGSPGHEPGDLYGPHGRKGDGSPVRRHEAVGPLLTALGGYPTLLAALTTDYAPDRLSRHLVATADAFFRFHDVIRVLPLGPEKPSAAHRARLALAEAAGTVLAGGLSLLGIDAPEFL